MIENIPITALDSEKSKYDNVLIVDVRDAKSYAEGHVKGAINIPLDDLTHNTTWQVAEVCFVLCGGGTKAGRAVQLLESMNPAKHYVELKGGTRGARAAGMELETSVVV